MIDKRGKRDIEISQYALDVGIQHTIKIRNVLLLRHNVLDARKLVITKICVSRQSKQTVTHLSMMIAVQMNQILMKKYFLVLY
jgi:hypothetical protein